MKIFDAHLHTFADTADTDPCQIGLVCCGTHAGDWRNVEQLCKPRAYAHAAYGIHPWYVGEAHADPMALDTLAQYLLRDRHAGVGEIGLDHSRKGIDRGIQRELFVAQLRLGISMGRFVCIHCVRAWGALLECLDAVDIRGGRLMVHGFGGSSEVASELVKRGVYLSFGDGKVQAAKQDQIVAGMASDFLLIETDAEEGCDSEEAWYDKWVSTLVRLARVRGDDPEQLAATVFRNSLRFIFGP